MEGSEIVRYRWPLYSFFFKRGRELSFGKFQVLRVSDVEREAE